MKISRTRSLQLTALALATAVLIGCGGGNGTGSTLAGSESALSAVGVTETASTLRVTTASSSESGDDNRSATSSGAMVFAQTQYSFTASLTAGPDAGQTLSGILAGQERE